MGHGVSKSTVTRITKSLEERSKTLRSEPISQEMPYLWENEGAMAQEDGLWQGDGERARVQPYECGPFKGIDG